MRTIIDTAESPHGATLLLALLSGTYSEPEDFVRAGFAALVRDHGIGAEVAMAEVRAAWFADGSIVGAPASGWPASRWAGSRPCPMPRGTKPTSRASC
jgi:hypothetical protein